MREKFRLIGKNKTYLQAKFGKNAAIHKTFCHTAKTFEDNSRTLVL